MSARPNPYAAPTDPDAAHDAAASRSSAPPATLAYARLKYVYLASLLSPVVLSLVGLAVRPLMPLLGFATLAVMVAGSVAYFVWLHKTWSMLSSEQQRGTSAAAAVGYSFVPGLNLWWLFASNARIARGLGQTLAKHRTRVSAPTVLAWVTPALVSLCVFAVLATVFGPHTPPAPGAAPAPPGALTMFLPFLGLSPFLWFAWMVRVDGCNQEILFQRAEKRAEKAEKAEKKARKAAGGLTDAA